MRTTTVRFFKPTKPLKAEHVHSIPGLRFITNFFSENECGHLVVLLDRLRQNLITNAQGQPFIVSKKHNLSSEEQYQKVILENGKLCQHFSKYGEEGHELTYFIGNPNIPQFVKKFVILPLQGLNEIKALEQQKQNVFSLRPTSPVNNPLNWNLTFNTYLRKDTPSSLTAGFPFHIDIASNGDISLICSFTSEATIEMRKKGEINPSHTFKLIPGSLLLLSDEARWEWEHRLVKAENVDTRYSLVLGCR